MRNRTVYLCALSVLALVSVAAGEITWSVEYTDAAGSGFYDAQLGSARQAAFQRALDAWSFVLNSNVTIRLKAGFESLGGSTTNATLGSAAPDGVYKDFAGAAAGVYYPAALADAIAGAELGSGASDMHMTFNVDIDGYALGDAGWSYAEDGPTRAGDIDFQTVAMHEIAHGLGFYATFKADGSYGIYGGTPMIMDTLLVTADGVRLIDQQTDSETVTGDVYFAGENAVEEWTKIDRSGLPVMYAPYLFSASSSLSHVDTKWFRGPYSLMRPWYDDYAIRMVDNITLGMLEDMGWSVNYPHAPEPTVTVILAMTGLLVLRRRRVLKAR
ncbi:MAG: hypothetical protein ACLFUJ_05315 [Phycisphaerae bacterium]